jgi:hypothetical protein
MKYGKVFFVMCLFSFFAQGCGWGFFGEQQAQQPVDGLQKPPMPSPLALERNKTGDRFPGQNLGSPRIAAAAIPAVIAALQARKAQQEESPAG